MPTRRKRKRRCVCRVLRTLLVAILIAILVPGQIGVIQYPMAFSQESRGQLLALAAAIRLGHSLSVVVELFAVVCDSRTVLFHNWSCDILFFYTPIEFLDPEWVLVVLFDEYQGSVVSVGFRTVDRWDVKPRCAPPDRIADGFEERWASTFGPIPICSLEVKPQE